MCLWNEYSGGKYEKTKSSNFCKKMFMSSKTVLSNIIPVVNQKGYRLYDLFVLKVAFPSLYFVFRVFFVILPALQFVVFACCVEWVIALQTIFW